MFSLISYTCYFPCHEQLPLDSRTVLKTPRVTKTNPLLNGAYCHFGFIEDLKLRLVFLFNISRYDLFKFYSILMVYQFFTQVTIFSFGPF